MKGAEALDWLKVAGLVGVGLAVLYAWRKAPSVASVAAAVQDAASSAVHTVAWAVEKAIDASPIGLAQSAGTEAVLRIGDAVGVPRTSETECAKALREGRMWDASFACPAAEFVKGAWRSVADGAAAPAPSSPPSTGGATGSW